MTWRTTGDLHEFRAATGELLSVDSATNTLMLSTVDNLVSRGPHAYGDDDPRFGWWAPDGTVTGAYLQTPPHPVILSDLPAEAVAPLVATLDPDRVNATRDVADAVTAIWRARTGTEPQVERHDRLYRLGQLIPPDPAPAGQARLATDADRDRLLDWYLLFHQEVGEGIGDLPGIIADRIGFGGLTLWEVDGEPVAMAGRTRVSAGMVRIGPVFTPAELRGRGYASAVTAAVSRAAQDVAGKVLLFTDVANPISNAIYQRLGYQAVHDRMVVHCR
jgi:RimJ/RimL family protein N-acetyltransferase